MTIGDDVIVHVPKNPIYLADDIERDREGIKYGWAPTAEPVGEEAARDVRGIFISKKRGDDGRLVGIVKTIGGEMTLEVPFSWIEKA